MVQGYSLNTVEHEYDAVNKLRVLKLDGPLRCFWGDYSWCVTDYTSTSDSSVVTRLWASLCEGEISSNNFEPVVCR